MLLINEENTLNYSPSCERNQDVILKQLLPILSSVSSVLEIGSYSGQHALHFCSSLSHLNWQPSDQHSLVANLNENLHRHNIDNIKPAIELDVSDPVQWPETKFDLIFSANTLHIMSWQHVVEMFNNLPKCLNNQSYLCIYGPFKYNGQYTSSSNANFQLWLQNRDPVSGIRDFEKINELAEDIGLTLLQDIAMPANNQLLIWKYENVC
ncbi:DUF938 domain-containing protein [Thalassotalea nanhaiensis]|uniref:DUF938 domain-containing protein n=1 Tax=Thalassotalea nanhaiensis TaxID=3065648 RepID=A0ABY9THL9_9GAMM|nr:DUF938 domain-containing protein [Colwelliaceae bacterium SQ345]